MNRRRYPTVYFWYNGVELEGFVIHSTRNGWHTVKTPFYGTIFKFRTGVLRTNRRVPEGRSIAAIG